MRKTVTQLMGASIAIAAVAAMAPNAAALTLAGYNCNLGTVTGTTTCAGAYTGNDSNQDLNGLFGFDWGSELLKAEEENNFEDGALDISGGGNTSGTWSLAGFDFSAYDELMFVVKGGTTFSAYLWDGVTTSGTWNTLGIINNGGRNPGISHFAVYGVPGDEPPTEVPEPLATLGLVAVAGGLLTLRRQR